ncbi:hypothetical protein SAMN02745751_02587 [Dethiosulfatibacter aminovorans DSM 17477]|uniref:Uncharacterized protein n=1 Tax=Dethiosulfatibacter aminovorans DSM 17477 TaxID=1121476 RepID=A0A1M6JDY0_9FIRM|nr:hypothetical protein [Dethiosulfatibacter aminovorans]SHJ44865.1 hypothetical protein SAMN02745751_02587 [Dethiosulfatibacter aminovorans DSM 17477]
MKKLSILLIVTLILGITLTTAMALEDADGTKLSGEHYTLNIIGVTNPKTADMTGSNRNTIFVPLEGKSKISLMENNQADPDNIDIKKDLQVIDGNAFPVGTERIGEAIFMLPAPGLDPYVIGQDMTGVDVLSAYSIYVRPLGKPLGSATITTCADIIEDGENGLKDFLSKSNIKVLNDAADLGGYASIEQVGSLVENLVTYRTKGKTQFTNVTAELTTIVLKVGIFVEDELVETIYVRVPIFDEILENEYWEYDNNGLKHLQVRFYPIETDVSLGDGDL